MDQRGYDNSRRLHLYQLKFNHMQLNRSKIKRTMEKNEGKLDDHFLGQKIIDGLGLWGKEFHSLPSSQLKLAYSKK